MRIFVIATFLMNVAGVALHLIQATRLANRRSPPEAVLGHWLMALGFGAWAFWAGSVLWPIK